ncbi:MAG TPA: ABC transporter ATP-binding protein [Stellaceae bacterium]|nr:ABC transporter ATP-binding protein [Stellaceae bacterium]
MSEEVPALQTHGLSKAFGALQVARDIDFRLERGARQALIGPNGAGKTTFLNLVTGVITPDRGRIELAAGEVTGIAQAERVKRGLVRTFQINTLCRGLSVLENVSLAVRERLTLGAKFFRPAGVHGEVNDAASAVLEQVALTEDAHKLVRELPYGRQRLVEIAVALALSPKVLLLDEPAAGVPSAESGIIIELIERLPAEIAVLIIEHDMDLVFRLARRITVLVAGSILCEGTPEEIAADATVRQVYLGERHP